MKLKIIVAFLFFSLAASSQQLSYKSGGNVYSGREKLSPDQVRTILEKNPLLLEQYNSGRDKKSTGNVLLVIGSGLIAADLVTALSQDKVYPSALTPIGILSILIAIPVKIGFSKRIKKAVEGYNSQLTQNSSKVMFNSVSVCANQNGIGLKFTF